MRRRRDGRRALRLAGAVLMVAGAASIVWALVVWQWQDPFTNLYTAYQQRKLASSYKHRLATYKPPVLQKAPAGAAPKPSIATEQLQIAVAARRYRTLL